MGKNFYKDTSLILCMKYHTGYTAQECQDLMARRSIDDGFLYTYEKTGERTGILRITGRAYSACSTIQTMYYVTFEENEDTAVVLKFHQAYGSSPFPCIPKRWVDEFMIHKLQVKPESMETITYHTVGRKMPGN